MTRATFNMPTPVPLWPIALEPAPEQHAKVEWYHTCARCDWLARYFNFKHHIRIRREHRV